MPMQGEDMIDPKNEKGGDTIGDGDGDTKEAAEGEGWGAYARQ